MTLTEKASRFLVDEDIKLEVYKTDDLVLKKIAISDDDSAIIHLTC